MKKVIKIKSPKSKEKIAVEKSGETYKDLYSVMDRKRTFKMIYSGVESEENFEILYDLGIRDFLMSFHYITEKKISMKKYADKGVKFFIDSGAHTYQNDPKYSEYGVEYWEEHLKRYLKWAEANKEYIFAIASFDFESMVDPAIVNDWYRKYFEPFMLRTGIPVCFVWHQNSHLDWNKYCERYPYVGFSSINLASGEAIDLNEYLSKLKIAQKHNTLVHGFGMTRTSMLTKVPFYTSDSTTYLVGVQYGEINWWNGNKMTRLKKDKWKTPEMLAKFEEMGIDSTRLEEENAREMTKANAMAFILAQEYIDTKLAPRMYWLMAEAVKNNLEDLSMLPTASAISNGELSQMPEAELRKLATSLNINGEYADIQWVQDCITDMTTFLTWEEPEYEELRPYYRDNEELLGSIHEQYINTIRASAEEKINDLIQFFKDVFTGENKKLLNHGTNFDVTAKERDTYIEEDTHEEIDVSLAEYIEAVNHMGIDMLKLTAPKESAEDIERLDAEIFDRTGMLTVRDEKGRLIKGQKRIKRPKNLYSDKYPKLACNNCYAAQTCPEFKEGYVCAYHKMFKRFDTRNMGDVLEGMQSLANMSLERVQKAMLFEQLDGGRPTADTSQLMNQAMQMMNNINALYENGGVILKHVKRVNSDGSIEETTSVQNPSNEKGGLMEKLFNLAMNKNVPEEEKQEVIDADYKEAKDNEEDSLDQKED